MKVITLKAQDFEAACRKLARLADDGRGAYTVVGVREGGAHVGEIVYDELKNLGSAERYFDVRASRGGTSVKELGFVKAIVRVMPQWATGVLRVLEHNILSSLKSGSEASPRNIHIGDDLESYLRDIARSGKPARILLVDDAIDSGSTMSLLTGCLADISPRSEIQTAVIVVTQKTPLITPDYSLYRDVLIRFPWSHDFDHA